MKTMQGIGAGLFVVLALSACAFDAEKETGLGENQQALVNNKVAPQQGLNGYVRSDNISAVVYTSAGNPHMKELALVSGHWSRSDLTTLTGAVNSTPFHFSAYVRADGPSTVVFRSDDGHIRELALSGGSWSKADLTALTGAALGATPPHGYVRGDNVSAVVYVSTDNHVRELSLRPGGSWAAADLTAIAHAPAVDTGWEVFGYVRGDGTTSVIYRTTDRHLRELALVGSTWQSFDLTASAGAPVALMNGRPYTRSDGTSSVLFLSDDMHVRELALVGGAWKSFDLSSATGAPLAALGYDPIPYVRSDGRNTVIYPSADRHIRELSMSPAGTWSVADLTAITGAPVSFGDTAGAYVRSDLVNAVIYYDANEHIHELSLPKGGSTWRHADLTTIAGGP